MLETPENIKTAIKRRDNTIIFLILVNLIIVIFLTLLFLSIFGLDLRAERFFFSYRLAFLLIIILIQFIIFQRFFIFFLLIIFSLGGKRVTNKKPHEQFGKYSAEEILGIIKDQCEKMKVSSVKRIYVIKSTYSNALTTDIILFTPFRFSVLVIFSNVFEIMNRDELTAIIGHEVAHVKNYDSWYLGLVGNPTLMMFFVLLIWFESISSSINFPNELLILIIIVIVFYLLMRPLVKRMVRYCEYYADYTSAKVNGLIPMINGLIKLGQRVDTLIAFQQEFQRRFRLDWKLSFSSKFYKKLQEELKDVIDPNDAIKKARRIVNEFGGSERKDVNQLSNGFEFFKPKIIDWKKYDNHIQDYSLDFIELDQFVKDLKDSPQSRIFRYASTNRFIALFQTHPRFRERIIFLWDSQKDRYEKVTYEVPIFANLNGIEKIIDKIYICPICQIQFKLKKDPSASQKIKCPNCRIPGDIKF